MILMAIFSSGGISGADSFWEILFLLFPIIFITALGAMIGSWISFGKEKLQSKK
tara:strand:- start:396 stop:557 length:162 start_codon:yes stop_codon:yes gene_type:complete